MLDRTGREIPISSLVGHIVWPLNAGPTMIKLFACAVGLFFATSTLAAPPILEFKGICDASAAIALDEKRIIVADDEKPWLSVYNLETRQSESLIPLPVVTTTSGRSHDPLESDIEAATILGDQIVWISSHGRNKNGKVRSSRSQLFASQRLSVDGATWERSFSRSLSRAARQHQSL